MRKKLLKLSRTCDKLNSKIGRTLTYKQLTELASRRTIKIRCLIS